MGKEIIKAFFSEQMSEENKYAFITQQPNGRFLIINKVGGNWIPQQYKDYSDIEYVGDVYRNEYIYTSDWKTDPLEQLRKESPSFKHLIDKFGWKI